MYQNDPRIIKAKFDSVCKETGAKIPKGVNCLYFPIGKAVFTLDSKEAENWRMNLQDQSFNNQSF